MKMIVQHDRYKIQYMKHPYLLLFFSEHIGMIICTFVLAIQYMPT